MLRLVLLLLYGITSFSSGDHGGNLDPNGRPAPTSDHGGNLDPDG